MTGPDMQKRPTGLTDWLAELLAARTEDLRQITIDAMAASGIATASVRCVLHGRTFTFVGVCRHLIETEQEWASAHLAEAAAGGRLHTAGALRPPLASEERPPMPWTKSTCRSCKAEVVWADTMGGSRMPVDVATSPIGNIALVAPTSGSIHDRPLAVVYHVEAERDAAPEDTLHLSHFVTCPNAKDWRRSP